MSARIVTPASLVACSLAPVDAGNAFFEHADSLGRQTHARSACFDALRAGRAPAPPSAQRGSLFTLHLCAAERDFSIAPLNRQVNEGVFSFRPVGGRRFELAGIDMSALKAPPPRPHKPGVAPPLPDDRFAEAAS